MYHLPATLNREYYQGISRKKCLILACYEFSNNAITRLSGNRNSVAELRNTFKSIGFQVETIENKTTDVTEQFIRERM